MRRMIGCDPQSLRVHVFAVVLNLEVIILKSQEL